MTADVLRERIVCARGEVDLAKRGEFLKTLLTEAGIDPRGVNGQPDAFEKLEDLERHRVNEEKGLIVGKLVRFSPNLPVRRIQNINGSGHLRLTGIEGVNFDPRDVALAPRPSYRRSN